MTVWCLLGLHPYEGPELMGVYSSEALAMSAALEFDWDGDEWTIVAVLVDTPAMHDWQRMP